MTSIIMMALLVVLVLLGAPIGFTLILLPTLYVLFIGDIPLLLIPNQMFEAINAYTLVAIPFFMLTGELMTTGAITDRLVDFSSRIIGRMRGSLAQVNILVSMFFAGMNGSVVADTATVGSLLIPAMKLRGYEPEFAAGLTARQCHDRRHHSTQHRHDHPRERRRNIGRCLVCRRHPTRPVDRLRAHGDDVHHLRAPGLRAER